MESLDAEFAEAGGYGTGEVKNCQLCGGIHDTFGTLTDQNRHRWEICADCIAFLWKYRQQEHLIAQYEAGLERSVNTFLERFRALLLKGDDD